LCEIPQPNLLQLDLSFNKISSCSDFKGHRALKVLNLENNQLALDQGVKDMPKLEELNLSGN
jgi:Leucine-rich repeat (LRR) protein